MTEFHMVVTIGALIFAGILLFKGNRKPLYGNARLANGREVKKSGLLDGKGIIVGKFAGKYLQFGGTQHISLVAPTRSGKGVGVVITNLLNYISGSIVMTDIKGEGFKITSKWRQLFAKNKVYKFAPFDEVTHQYNPLSYISDDPFKRVSDVLNIGYMLYPKAQGNTDAMWSDNARDLFLGITLYLIESPKHTASLGEVLRQSSGLGKPLAKHLETVLATGSYSEACTNALTRFIKTPDVTAGGIVNNFTSPLSIFSSPLVDAATTGNDFDLRKLREEKMTVYVVIPPRMIDQAGIILQLFYGQLLSLNTDEELGTSDHSAHPVFVLLDELAALPRMKSIQTAMGHCASFGIRLLIIAQSAGQLTKPISDGGYGREGAKEMMDNAALNIYFRPKDQKDADDLSILIGSETVKSLSKNVKQWGGGNESPAKRQLYMAQELRLLDGNTCFVDLDNDGLRMIKADKIRYHDDSIFTKRLQSVSEKLKLLGNVNLTDEDIKGAANELSIDVPKIDVALSVAKRQGRTRKITEDDIKKGIKLEAVDADLESLPEHKLPMNDDSVKAFADAYIKITNDRSKKNVR